MGQLCAPDMPVDELNHVGIGIKVAGGTQLHCGLLYRKKSAAVRFLHLAFHHRLQDELPDSTIRWADLALDDDNKVVLAVYLSKFADSSIPIPYGFNFEGLAFDSTTGELLPPPPGKGMTCATFVVAAVSAFGFNMIDLATWPEREDDEAWQAAILEPLRLRASQEHVELVAQSIGAKRLRPEEVVGAATIDPWPVKFQDARLAADQILADLAAA